MGYARRALDALSLTMSVIAGFIVVYLMLITVADVTRRNLLDGKSLPLAFESTEVLLGAVAFLTLAWSQHERQHVAVEVLTARLQPRAATRLRMTVRLLCFIPLAWILAQTIPLAMESLAGNEVRAGVFPIPIWPVRFLLTLGLAMLALQMAFQSWDELAALRGGSLRDEERSGGTRQSDAGI